MDRVAHPMMDVDYCYNMFFVVPHNQQVIFFYSASVHTEDTVVVVVAGLSGVAETAIECILVAVILTTVDVAGY
jgi:hypothetical protein